MKFLHPELTWKEFERHCEALIDSCVDKTQYRIDPQYNRTYNDGQNFRMDCHIAERRVGGKGMVIDFKHFPIAKLNRNEIMTTENYRRKCRASAAIIMYSYQSNFTNNFFEIAQEINIHTFEIDFSRIYKAKNWFKGFFLKKESFNPSSYLY